MEKKLFAFVDNESCRLDGVKCVTSEPAAAGETSPNRIYKTLKTRQSRIACQYMFVETQFTACPQHPQNFTKGNGLIDDGTQHKRGHRGVNRPVLKL